MNENKSGVFINITTLKRNTAVAIDYMKYIDEQQENLKTIEYQKKEFEDYYFTNIN